MGSPLVPCRQWPVGGHRTSSARRPVRSLNPHASIVSRAAHTAIQAQADPARARATRDLRIRCEKPHSGHIAGAHRKMAGSDFESVRPPTAQGNSSVTASPDVRHSADSFSSS
jgi:hypothetical protein